MKNFLCPDFPSSCRMLRVLVLAVAFVFLSSFFPQAAEAQVVEIDGDRITIRARNNTLQEVLLAIAEEGVKVRVDPGVEADVHGDLINTPIQKALELMLADFGYSIRFKAIDGPVGKISRVSQLDVFRNGFAGRARTLRVKKGLYDIYRDPVTGMEYIRDEIVVAITQPMEKEEFLNAIASVGGRVVDGLPGAKVYRVRLRPNSDVPGVIQRLAETHPAIKVEPNLAIRQPTPEPSGDANLAQGAGEAGSPTSPTAGTTGNVTPASSPQPSGPAPTPVPGTPAIAVLDSGLSPDLKLGDLLQASFDATNPANSMSDAAGHGSQMALIASGTINPLGTAESENGTPVVAIRSFDENGATSNFDMMRAIDFAQQQGSSVMSLSWGSEQQSDFMASTIKTAQDRGMVVVAAAGNVPNGNVSYPAGYDNVIGVGALTGTGELWEKSNYGKHVDVVAPGQASFPIGHEGPPGNYSGTSISTPYVARAFSQYMQRYPEASQEEMLRDFNNSLRDAGSTGRDDNYGNGVFDDDSLARFLNQR